MSKKIEKYKDPEEFKKVWRTINLKTWNFCDDSKFNKIIGEYATEAVKNSFEESPPYCSLPFKWTESDGLGGKETNNVLLLHIALPLSSDCEPVYYRIDLKKRLLELNEEMIELGEEEKQKSIPKQLRDLADEIERQFK
jgi:hypothetical protein